MAETDTRLDSQAGLVSNRGVWQRPTGGTLEVAPGDHKRADAVEHCSAGGEGAVHWAGERSGGRGGGGRLCR